MRFFAKLVAVVLLAGSALMLYTSTSAALPIKVDGQALPTLAPMLSRITPAVVNIATHSPERVHERNLFNDPFFRRFFDMPTRTRERPSQSLGSGVIVDASSGYVLTNGHVIEDAQTITVTLADGRQFEARIVGVDSQSDVAVIQIPAENLTAIPVADSDVLRVGDFVVAIGNPFGLGQTVTSGIVSALGRSGLGIEDYEDFIQTDASINPGNSGGALVNLRGELVGINTAIVGPNGGNIGIGFAIPSNMTKQIMGQLIDYGEVQRGRLGISAQDLTPTLARAFNLPINSGVMISRIAPDSSAARAGLEVGDIITEVNGRKINGASSMRNAVGLLRVGQNITMNVLRDGHELMLRAVIEQVREGRVAGKAVSSRLDGAMLVDFLRQDGFDAGIGVAISGVSPGSPAWLAGLRKGDIILSANGRMVKNVEDLRRAAAINQQGLFLNVKRGQTPRLVLLQ